MLGWAAVDLGVDPNEDEKIFNASYQSA